MRVRCDASASGRQLTCVRWVGDGGPCDAAIGSLCHCATVPTRQARVRDARPHCHRDLRSRCVSQWDHGTMRGTDIGMCHRHAEETTTMRRDSTTLTVVDGTTVTTVSRCSCRCCCSRGTQLRVDQSVQAIRVTWSTVTGTEWVPERRV